MQHVATPSPPPPAVAPSPCPSASPSGGPGITPEQIQQLTTARQRCRKINRAAGVAAFSGWTLAFFAVVALLSGIFGLRALVLGIGMSFVAYVELKGSKGLRAFDVAAPRRLALNQIGLVAIITLYAVWGIYDALNAPGSYDDYIAMGGQYADTFQPIDDLTRGVSVAVGIALIIGSVIAQTATAVYYYTRRGHIVAFLRSTPGWVVDAVKT